MFCSNKEISYNLDLLIPGIYIWFFNYGIRLGGTKLDNNYNYTIKQLLGIAVVLPNLESFTTPYDFR